jgi:hypothetical protein
VPHSGRPLDPFHADQEVGDLPRLVGLVQAARPADDHPIVHGGVPQDPQDRGAGVSRRATGRPPRGMASRALTKRLTRTAQNWPGSISAVTGGGAATATVPQLPPPGLDRFGRLPDDRARIARAAVQGRRPGEVEQPLRRLLHAANLAVDDAQVLGGERLGRSAALTRSLMAVSGFRIS